MKSLLFIPLFFISFLSYSQIKTPSASTSSEINQMVGLTEIGVEYNRPSKKGREIFGNLVPFGKLWRTGANSSTKISFSTDVELSGEKIKEGKYSVFSIPNENEWDIILYSDSDLWSVPKDWDESKVVYKSSYKVSKLNPGNIIETFTISLNDITNNDANLIFAWDDTYVKVKIDVPTRQMVDESISKVMGGAPKASDFYSAAVYYRQENIKLDVAMGWMNKAMEMTENPRFFQLRQQALILAANEMYEEAVNVSRRSLRLSIDADNQDYVKMNRESIAEWSKNL